MSQEHQTTANQKAIEGMVKFFAALIIIAAIVYSEILFLGIVSGLFPSGPLAIGAMIGAITTGLSIMALCLAKSHWFRPGQQLIIAWIFTIVEIAVLVMNDILAYELHTGASLDQFTSMWRLFCVAAPALSLVGWILLFYFDSQRAIQHKRLEMLDNQQRAQIDFEHKMHRKIMEVQNTAGDMVASRLAQKIETQMEYQLDDAAARFTARVASQLIGEPVAHSNFLSGSTPKQLSSRIVDADPVEEDEESEVPSQAASRTQVVDPHQVKPQVDNEVKPLEKKGLWERLKGTVNFSIPDETLQETVMESPVEQESIDSTPETVELPDNYLNWTDAQWKQAKKELTQKQYTELFDEVFPDEGLKPTPKKKATLKKKVSRREVLGMEKPDA